MIRIDLASLRKFWDRGTQELRVVMELEDYEELEADGGEEMLRQMSLEIGQDLAPAGNPVTTEQWLRTTDGWSAAMFEVTSLDDAEEWLEQLTARLQGLAGIIRGGPRNRKAPAWSHDGRAAVTAQLYCTTIDLRQIPPMERRPVWGVEKSLTVEMADRQLLWAHRNRATKVLLRDGDWTVHTVELDHANTMAEAIERYAIISIGSFRRDQHHCRRTAMYPGGHLVAQNQDAAPWPDRVAAVRDVLLWNPPRSDYGYIHWANGGGAHSDSGESWPHVTEPMVRGNRPLLASFVPDAFAVQLLTDAHLERANDLTDWDITPLEGGRHVVQARDLDPWFGPIPNRTDRDYWLHDAPPHDPAVVQKARDDFGAMILTPELIHEHDPWR